MADKKECRTLMVVDRVVPPSEYPYSFEGIFAVDWETLTWSLSLERWEKEVSIILNCDYDPNRLCFTFVDGRVFHEEDPNGHRR